MAAVGYARVRSVGQSLNVQLDKLKGYNKVFQSAWRSPSLRRKFALNVTNGRHYPSVSFIKHPQRSQAQRLAGLQIFQSYYSTVRQTSAHIA